MPHDLAAQAVALLQPYPWAAELSGILPLSALVEFIRGPDKLHVLQLSGNVPTWSWAVTPAMSKLLLGSWDPGPSCFLDRHGNSLAMECLDGRYGDRYFAANPETIRLCLASRQPVIVVNGHQNMALPDSEKRPHQLEVVHVRRLPSKPAGNLRFPVLSAAGWSIIASGIFCSALFELYLATIFLTTVVLTGIVISTIHGGGGRKFLVEKGSDYQRLVIGSSHMNETSWYLFYGESTLVNSLLNRSLTRKGTTARTEEKWYLRLALRALILGQWASAIGAAATKDLDGFIITAWILFCIISHSYLYPPTAATKDWMQSCGQFDLTRYSTTLSSRRTLLNTILALNEDAYEGEPGCPEKLTQREEGLRCIDAILARGGARTKWETATLGAMNRIRDAGSHSKTATLEDPSPFGPEWQRKHGSEYWSKFIPEGIYIAAKIKEKMNGR